MDEENRKLLEALKTPAQGTEETTRKLALDKEIVGALVGRLDIAAGNIDATHELRSQIVGALAQERETILVLDNEYQMDRWVVLGTITTFNPLVRAHLHRGADPNKNWGCACKAVLPRLAELGWLGRQDQLATEEVAGWFAERCNGLDEEVGSLPSTWAPGAVESFALIPLAGDLGEGGIKATTRDIEWESNCYEWFDLTDVPVGGSVYRVSATKTLWLFTRREDDRWEITIVPELDSPRTRQRRHFGDMVEGALIASRAM